MKGKSVSKLIFSYKQTSQISHGILEAIAKKLRPEISQVRNARLSGYESVYASINLSSDSSTKREVYELVRKKHALKPSVLIVIGVGGSNLGTIAIQEALYGRFYNEQGPSIKVYWADTVDSDYILDIILLLEQEFQAGREVLLNVVSKSGKTTETIANFEVLLDIIKRNRPYSFRDYVVVTTGEGTPLWKFAEEEQFDKLAIPNLVGGRFSILSAVGLFPLALLGVDIETLLSGAQEMVESCASDNFFENPAALYAAILYAFYSDGININDIFLFSNDLQSLGMWYRQLLAESVNKKYDIDGNIVNIGLTPTVSVGSTDLHSMVQLHLAGLNNTFTTFVSVKENKSNISVPCFENFEQLVANIQCKSLSSIMEAIFQGVQRAYENNNRPYASIVLPKKNAWCVGEFLQMNMIAIIYLGYLLHINPFDQPEVELYKKQTRKILAHE